MGKKVGVNSKAEEAKARKEAVVSTKKAKEEVEAEESKWRDEGGKTKASKKKEEEAEKKAEAARKKAELKKLAEAEEKEMEKVAKKAAGAKAPSEKVTAAALAKVREKEEQERAKAAAESKKKSSRMVDESEYEKLVGVENTNRMETLVDARSLTEAVEQLSVGEAKVDAHPEKRMKAAYKAFEEAELAALKQDRPGMTLTQYKDLVWKAWKKSPQNPLNQASSSGN